MYKALPFKLKNNFLF